MNFSFLILAIFASCAFAAPAEPENIILEDQVLENIEKVFYKVLPEKDGVLVPNFRIDPVKHIFLKVGISSVDRKCMYRKYADNKVLKYINLDEIKENPELGFVFASIAFQCSSKLDVLGQFVFDNFMTYHILYDAFVDEPALKNYTSYVKCANKYAIDNHVLEETVHGTKLKVPSGHSEICDEFNTVYKAYTSMIKIMVRRKFERTCVISFLDYVEKVLFRTTLLIQVDLTPDQQKQEREKFVQEIHEVLKNVITCAKTQRSDFIFEGLPRF